METTTTRLTPELALPELRRAAERLAPHLLTYHGVLAPAAIWRELIVPRPPSSADGTHGAQPHEPSSESAPSPSARQPQRRTRSTWAELTLRAFSIDVLRCSNCGRLRELIAFLTEGLVVRKILAHLGLPTEAPRLAPSRGPPEFEFAE